VARRGRGPEPVFSDEKCSALRKEYESGMTLDALARQEGVSHTTIHRALLRVGTEMRRRGNPAKRVRKGILGWLDS